MNLELFTKEVMLLVENIHYAWQKWNTLSFHELAEDHYLCYVDPAEAYVEYRAGEWILDENNECVVRDITLHEAHLASQRMMLRRFNREATIQDRNDILWVTDDLNLIEASVISINPSERTGVVYKNEEGEIVYTSIINTFLNKEDAIKRILYRAERRIRLGHIHSSRLRDLYKEVLNE